MRLGSLPSSAASGMPAAIASASQAGDVESRHRHAHDALHADQREALGELAPEIDRRDALAFDPRATSSRMLAIAGMAAGK